MKKTTVPEKFNHMISEIEIACKGTAWEVEILSGRKPDSFRIAIRLTNEARRQQFENRGVERYAPEIYFDEDSTSAQPWGFRIQTTSYGALPPSEIAQFAAAYLRAAELTATLTSIIKTHCEV